MHLLWLLNLRKIETTSFQAAKRFHEQALVPELKLSFEQVSQEVMVVERIGTYSVFPRGRSVDLSTRKPLLLYSPQLSFIRLV